MTTRVSGIVYKRLDTLPLKIEELLDGMKGLLKGLGRYALDQSNAQGIVYIHDSKERTIATWDPSLVEATLNDEQIVGLSDTEVKVGEVLKLIGPPIESPYQNDGHTTLIIERLPRSPETG